MSTKHSSTKRRAAPRNRRYPPPTISDLSPSSPENEIHAQPEQEDFITLESHSEGEPASPAKVSDDEEQAPPSTSSKGETATKPSFLQEMLIQQHQHVHQVDHPVSWQECQQDMEREAREREERDRETQERLAREIEERLAAQEEARKRQQPDAQRSPERYAQLVAANEALLRHVAGYDRNSSGDGNVGHVTRLPQMLPPDRRRLPPHPGYYDDLRKVFGDVCDGALARICHAGYERMPDLIDEATASDLVNHVGLSIIDAHMVLRHRRLLREERDFSNVGSSTRKRDAPIERSPSPVSKRTDLSAPPSPFSSSAPMSPVRELACDPPSRSPPRRGEAKIQPESVHVRSIIRSSNQSAPRPATLSVEHELQQPVVPSINGEPQPPATSSSNRDPGNLLTFDYRRTVWYDPMDAKLLLSNPLAVLTKFEQAARMFRVPEDVWGLYFITSVPTNAPDEHPGRGWRTVVMEAGVHDWQSVADHFRQYFNTRLTMAELMQELRAFKWRPSETVGSAAARFNAVLARHGFGKSNKMHYAGTHFLESVPKEIRDEYSRGSVADAQVADPEFDELLKDLQEAERIIRARQVYQVPPAEPSSSRQQAAHRTPPPTAQHRRPSESGGQLPVDPSMMPTVCPLHPREYHSLNRCSSWLTMLSLLRPLEAQTQYSISELRQYVKTHHALPDLSDPTLFRPRTTPNPRTPSDRNAYSTPPPAPRGDVCYRCHQPGHRANECHRSSTPGSSRPSAAPRNPGDVQIDPNRRIAHIVYTDELQLPAYNFNKNNEIYSCSWSETAAQVSHLSVMSELWKSQVKKLLNFQGELPERQKDTDPLLVKLIINTKQVVCEIDTGCSHAVMPWALVKLHKWEYTRKPSKCEAYGPSNTVEVLGSTPEWSIRDGIQEVRHSFLVVKTQEDDGVVMLGRDLLAKLGYNMWRLPLSVFGTTVGKEDAEEQRKELDAQGCEEHPLRPHLLQALQEAFDVNAQVEGFCTHPRAEVQFTIPNDIAKPWQNQYKIPQSKFNQMDETIKSWLDAGRIEAATSDTTNLPLTGAPKKNPITGEKTDIRTNIDGRPVNEILKATGQIIPPSLPKIDELFDRLSEAEIITVLDISDAFPSCRVHPETRKYLQFTWNGARYQFVGMPFGILFMSAKFQNLMVEILKECHSFVVIFVDDIVVFSRRADEHEAQVKQVIATLTRWNLKVKMAKAQIGYRYAIMLGHRCGGGGILPDKRKLMGIEDWPKPTADTIEHYLGLLNYFRKFIPVYATLAAPMEKVRKNFDWQSEQEEAWQAMKRALVNAPMLHFPDWEKHMFVCVDAAPEGVSAVLFQMASEEDEERWRHGDVRTITSMEPSMRVKIIAMQSRATKQHERAGYSQNKLETLALRYALEQFRSYLLGRVFTVFTDHQALVWMFSKSKTNRTVAGWLDIITEFSFYVVHLPGVRNVLNDILSRIWPKDERGGGDPSTSQRHGKASKSGNQNPAFEPQAVEVKHLRTSGRVDLSSLDKVQWRTRFIGPLKMKNNRHCSTPAELLTALELIFGKMHDPCPLDHTTNGLETRWSNVNFIHPPYTGENIEKWIAKALQQAEKHNCLSILLLPEWRKKAWFIKLASHAQFHFFKNPIRFDPYVQAAPYRSVLVIIDKRAALDIKRATLPQLNALELKERIGRSVVEDPEERTRLVNMYHQKGHMGTKAILDGLTAGGFRWPNMMMDIKKVVQECMPCHRFIIKKEGFHPITSITANMPMDQIAMDLFDMPTSEEGYIKGLVIVDVCTRFVWIRALRTAMAKDVARQLYKLFCLVGFPKIIQSDNGPEFRATLIHQLGKLVEAEHRFSTPYHPQGNGLAEAFVKKAKTAILKSLEGVTLHWKKVLPTVQSHLNNKVLSVHRSTPFSLFLSLIHI